MTAGFRVSLNIDHVHLVDEATPQPDDVYGIPDKLHHNRTMSRITGSPQVATSNSSSPQEKNPRTDDSERQEGPTSDKQLLRRSLSTSAALEELPVATQPASIVFSPEQPDYKVQLAHEWAARLERKASKLPVQEEGRRESRSVHCQCYCSEEEGVLVSSLDRSGNSDADFLTCGLGSV